MHFVKLASDPWSCALLENFNFDLLTDKSLARDMAVTFGFMQHSTAAKRITLTTASLINHVHTSGLEKIKAAVTEQHIAMSCSVTALYRLKLA